MTYDFKSLSDYDFELLCCDLLSAELGKRVEVFRRGRDHGIDLRCAGTGGGKMIVQCKHYSGTPFSGLCHTMASERNKIEKLQPERYLLMTSLPLTPREKGELFKCLQPFCRSTEDILGGNEVNALLRKHPHVEQTHYKLWLTSLPVLQKILHSAVYNQSEFLIEEIKQKLRLYVQSKTAFSKARKILDDYNCCILSGIPGIGKTTLAEILAIYYLDQDYEIVKIHSDIREAYDVYCSGRKQVFLYDDFLGSTTLEMKANRNEGKYMLAFLEHISRQKGKKFILTTREYILNQAKQNYEEFSRRDFDYNKCVISLGDYTKGDRARILYNHLFVYDVPGAYIENLLEGGRVMQIIGHPNYSPRLIESVIHLLRLTDCGHFYDFFMDTFDHPNKLWENSFFRQISPASRDLLMMMCTFSQPISLSSLKKYYALYHQHKAHMENRPLSSMDLMDALRESEGTFIKINQSFISYHNPSVRDFIQGCLRENDGEFAALCEGAYDFDQCIRLARMEVELGGSHRAPLLGAMNRTLGGGDSLDSLGSRMTIEQAENLVWISKDLPFPEVQSLMQDFIRQLPARLFQELKDMNADNWHIKVAPCVLKNLLDELKITGYGDFLDKEVCLGILRYAQAWFDWSFLYTIEDFLLFCDLSSVFTLPHDWAQFQKVYEALHDYQECLAYEHIQEFDLESECMEYIKDAESLEKSLRTDLSKIKMEADYHIARIQEKEEEREIAEPNEDTCKSFGRPLDDSAILDMFYSLSTREAGEKI